MYLFYKTIYWFRPTPFYIENIMYLFYKTSYFDEEVNCTEPSPSVRIPWEKNLPHILKRVSSRA
jgi:hypothetical protein